MRHEPEPPADKPARRTARWVSVKVTEDTKQLLEVLAAIERRPIYEIAGELVREHWDRVKETGLP